MPSMLAARHVSAWADGARWDREYQQIRSIPSSLRLVPSHALRILEPNLNLDDGARVLDAGAGGGRHALYLAAKGCNVDAVDVSGAACDLLSKRAAAFAPSNGSVRVVHAAVSASSLPDERYDLVVDAYVSCHLLTNDERLAYLDALLRILRPGGAVFTCVMGAGDQFYARHRTGPPESSEFATDPANGVTKLLQHPQDFASSLSALDATGVATTCTFDDAVRGTSYRRQVLAAIVRRR